ncbi:DNA cytosine methyltransferase [Actinokineospora enzanensis]|uniref:DNA cytosine methyltransferase n=1 Tax=Actinokineospora enzanensis TaxID=155975 RepID=UPI0003679DA9|nr:DNA cytosine methyltransferase [Actinokineospora enzanensis]
MRVTQGRRPSTGIRHRRWRLLDLFCKAGGASAGYHAAGFAVTGVDIEPQPHYPFPFIQADALTVDLSGFDVIAASPPCQAFSCVTPARRRADHADLVGPIRDRLQAAVAVGDARAYVIENVVGAPLIDPVTLCGDTLRLGVRRHRLFESNLPLRGTDCHHDRPEPAVPVYGTHGQRTSTGTADAEKARTAMGIDWMPWPALTQAIPPAYTFWLGTQLIGHLGPAAGDATTEPTDGPGDGTALVATVTGELRDSVTTRACRCGAPLTRPATGRWPRHCSPACRQAAYRARQGTNTRSRDAEAAS